MHMPTKQTCYSVDLLCLVLQGSCIYIIVEYQHPEDRTQAWFPKCVVLVGLWLAIAMVLMFPLVSAYIDVQLLCLCLWPKNSASAPVGTKK